CRRERHRRLQLRIVTAAGALEGVGPAMVEDVFALAVRLGIAGYGADQVTLRILQPEVMALPAGLARSAAGLLQYVQKIKGNERVVGCFATFAGDAGELAPFGLGESAYARCDAYRKPAAFGRLLRVFPFACHCTANLCCPAA